MVEETRKFSTSVIIYDEALDPFKFIPGVSQGCGHIASTSNAST